jgi:hypothetical protein
MLGHLLRINEMMKWMEERRLTKEIYEVDVGGNARRERPGLTFIDQIGKVLEKVLLVKSTRNWQAGMRSLMTVEEAKGDYKNQVASGRK